MFLNSLPTSSRTIVQRYSATLLSFLCLTAVPAVVLAHAGHGNEFHQSESAQSAAAVQLDRDTSRRIGIKVEPVTRRRLALGIKTTGQIEALPNQKVAVTTPVGGTVVKLLVSPGDRVAAGQAVAIMTSSELAELRTTALDRYAEATASVQQAQAELQLAAENYQQQQQIVASEIREAQVALRFAQERYDRDRELVQNGAIPRRQGLESEAELAKAKAHLAKAESGLPVSEAQAQLKRAKAAVQVAQKRLALSGETYGTRLKQLGTRANADGTITLTAAIAGTVADPESTAESPVKLGESRQDAGEVILTIINANRVQVAANLYEKDIAQIQKGQQVRGRVSNLPQRTFAGRISVVGAIVEGTSRVIPVKAELDNPGEQLKPGMFVELEVLTNRTAGAVLTVPKSAIVETNDKKTIVFVQNGAAFEPVEIELGQESGDWVEVKTGLFEGDQVVTQRANQLYTQSLRGENPKPAAQPQPSTLNPQSAFPWWLIIPATGAIASLTFWAGTRWAGRRNQADRVAAQESTESTGASTPDVQNSVLDPSNQPVKTAALPHRHH